MAPTKDMTEETANQKKLKQQAQQQSYETTSDEEEAAPAPKSKKSSSKKEKKPKNKKFSKKSDGLGLIKSDPTETLSGMADGVIGGGGQQQQQQGGGNSGGTLSLRLDLNLDVEVTLKARVHGDVTLALLA